MNDRILNAENAVLGTCLIDSNLWKTALEKLNANEICSEYVRSAFEFARAYELENDKGPTATEICTNGLDRSFLFDCMEIGGDFHGFEQNIQLIKEDAKRRGLADLGRMLEDGALHGESPAALQADAEQRLHDLAENDTQQLVTPVELCANFVDMIDKDKDSAVKTGLPHVDAVLGGGMLPGALYVMAARPACGKTALALQIADAVAAGGRAVLFATLEMSTGQLQARRIARATGVPVNRQLIERDLNEKEMQRVMQANLALQNVPLSMNCRERCSVMDIRSLARRVKDLKLIVIDYLGLIKSEKRFNSRYEEITEISGALKALARQLNVPVLCLAQLNRASEQRNDKKPVMADLRDSGSIEQDADAVILLHRPDMHTEPNQEPVSADNRQMLLNVAKNRHGKTGEIDLVMNMPSGRFYQYADR